jgi:hypothetical protein
MDPQALLSRAQDALTARRVFGDPIEVHGTTLLPAAIVRGGGGGGGDTGRGGLGFRLRARPLGVFAIRDGHVAWKPSIDVNRVIMGGQLVAVTALLTMGPGLMKWLRSRNAA